MPINQSHWGEALWPGINSWYMEAKSDYDPEWSKVFEVRNSRKAFEEIMGQTGLGYAAVKPDGEPVVYDTFQQGFKTRFQHIEYALGFIITRNMVDDDQYDVIGKQRARGLARSLAHTKEVVSWNVLNRADTSGYNGGDGVTLLNSAHPNKTGGTWSNILSTAADLSEAALEQAHIDIGNWTDDRGLKVKVLPKKLIIPDELQFEAERILETEKRIGTADNDIGTMYSGRGRIPGGVVMSHYLDDSNMWFLQTDVDDGLLMFSRRPQAFAMDNDFDTSNAKYKGDERYSVGWGNSRCVFGSNPA